MDLLKARNLVMIHIIHKMLVLLKTHLFKKNI